MIDFGKIGQREIKSKKLILRLEIELNDSRLTDIEAANRLSYLLNSYSSSSKCFSEFIVFLIRETKSSTWGMKKLEIENAT